MAKKNSKKTVPELRFRGFTDPWEQRQLGELYAPSREKNNGAFSARDIISVAGMRYASRESSNSTDDYMRTYNVMRVGDIAFEGHTSNEFAFGRFVENDLGNGIVSHVFVVLRPLPGRRYDLAFWKEAIHDEFLMKRILARSTKRSTMMHEIVVPDFLKEVVAVPSLSEQQKIGRFFSTLDSLIAAAERQEALLRQKKQAYLQLMFPREGENEPRVRFAGFSRKWEQRQLEELVSDGIIALKRGHVIPRQTGRYPVYSSSAAKDGLFCTSDSFMFDQELVTWSIDGGGKPFYRPRHRFSVTNVCGYALIRNPQTFTYRFLGLAMDRAWTRAHFDYSSKAHPSVIEKMYVLPIPSLPEQHRIGVFFSTLDSLIACAEKRAASLRALKSAYLQRMFV